MRLVPEDEVDPRLERGVGPAAAEIAVRRLVQAGGRQARSVGRHLARLGMVEHEAALGLAPERAAEPPWARLHLEAGAMRQLDEPAHRPPVVGEIVLGERVQHGRVAERGQLGHVALDMTRDPDTEVGAADSHRGGSLDRFRSENKGVVLTTCPELATIAVPWPPSRVRRATAYAT